MQFLLTNDKSRDLCGVRIVFKPKLIYINHIRPLLLKSGEPTCVLFNKTTKQIAVIYYFKNYLDYKNPMSLIHINLLRKFFLDIYDTLSHTDILDSDQKSFTGENIEINDYYDLNKLYTIEDIINNEIECKTITDKDILNIKRVFRVQQDIKIEAYKFLYNRVYKNSDPKWSDTKLVYSIFLSELNDYLYNKYDCNNKQRKRPILLDCVNLIRLNVKGIRAYKYKADKICQFKTFSWYLFKKDHAEFCSKYGYDPNDLKLTKRMYDMLA